MNVCVCVCVCVCTYLCIYIHTQVVADLDYTCAVYAECNDKDIMDTEIAGTRDMDDPTSKLKTQCQLQVVFVCVCVCLCVCVFVSLFVCLTHESMMVSGG